MAKYRASPSLQQRRPNPGQRVSADDPETFLTGRTKTIRPVTHGKVWTWPFPVHSKRAVAIIAGKSLLRFSTSASIQFKNHSLNPDVCVYCEVTACVWVFFFVLLVRWNIIYLLIYPWLTAFSQSWFCCLKPPELWVLQLETHTGWPGRNFKWSFIMLNQQQHGHFFPSCENKNWYQASHI